MKSARSQWEHRPTFAVRRRIVGVLAAFGLLLHSAGAWSQVPALSPLLFVAKQDVRTAYLFGSIHLGVDGMYPLPEYVRQAFAASETVAFELILDELDSSAVAEAIREHAELAPGVTLEDVLPAQLWRRAHRVGSDLGLQAKRFQSFRPWYLATQVALAKLRLSGYRLDQGVDLQLLKQARGARKWVLGLESFAEQVDAFGSMTTAAEIDYLAAALDGLDDTGTHAAALLGAWWRGESLAIEDYANRQIREAGGEGLYQRLIVARNRVMTRRIMAALERHPSLFVTVGVAHLVGPDALLEHMRAEGFKVTPVTPGP